MTVIKYDLTWLDDEDGGDSLARFSGLCPVCPKYIRKNLSRIDRIPEEWLEWAKVNGDGRGRRLWAHADCVRRLIRGEHPPFYPGGNAGEDGAFPVSR